MKSFLLLAKAAYEAYCTKATELDEEGLSTHIQTWSQLDQGTRECWVAAARTIVVELQSVH